MLWFIGIVIIGLAAGALARLIVPGRDPMGLGGTLALGLVGSIVGGTLGYVLFGADSSDGALQFGGIVGSIIGSVIALLVWRAISDRRGTTTGTHS